MKIPVEQEGIDINAKNNVYSNYLIFQNNVWSFFNIFKTALMNASENDNTEIVKILVEQEGIDINAKDDAYFNNLLFQNNIRKFFKLFQTVLMCASLKISTISFKLIPILAMEGNISVRVGGSVCFDVSDDVCQEIYDTNPVLSCLYPDYTALVYFKLAPEWSHYFDLVTTPPIVEHKVYEENKQYILLKNNRILVNRKTQLLLI